MAHEFETGFFVRHSAWHNLGNVLDTPPRTIDEALEAAGLTWRVEERPIFDELGHEIGGWKRLVRETDGRVYHVGSDGYQVLQNRDLFGWMQPLVDDGSVVLEAAGSLSGGKRQWVLAKIRGLDDQQIDSARDRVRAYLMISNGHGGIAVRTDFTPIRVVCRNTLRAATRDDRERSKYHRRIQHNAGMHSALEQARDELDFATGTFRETGNIWRKSAEIELSPDQRRAYFAAVVAPKIAEPDKRDHPTWEDVGPRVGAALEAAHVAQVAEFERPNSLWAAANAVTRYLDHERTVVGAKGLAVEQVQYKRLGGSVFGSGAPMRRRAFDCLEAVVEARDAATLEEILHGPGDGSEVGKMVIDDILG